MSIFQRLRTAFQNDRVDVEGRFEFLRASISGTMSRFYMAKDRKSGEVVGLKVCDSAKVDAFETRFQGLNKPSEGEIGAALNHPRVVKTLEHGITTDDARYLVMEYLRGPGLHTLIHAKDPVLEGKRATLIKQMAEALEHVHQARYIHRDICPRNFICAPDAASLKLIDFGLTLPAKPEFMQPGNRTGTAMYMAPEIVRRRRTDQRVDIFALGVTAYHLCAFELPWPSAENPAMTAMTHESVPPTDIFEFVPDLHPNLGGAIMQCLAAEPDKRPPTATDLLRMLRSVPCEHAS